VQRTLEQVDLDCVVDYAAAVDAYGQMWPTRGEAPATWAAVDEAYAEMLTAKYRRPSDSKSDGLERWILRENVQDFGVALQSHCDAVLDAHRAVKRDASDHTSIDLPSEISRLD
jgi:hypothetical protein